MRDFEHEPTISRLAHYSCSNSYSAVLIVPVSGEQNDAASRKLGSGWRNAQFSGSIVLVPTDWNHKSDGVTVKARMMGEPVYRRLMLEITHRNSTPSKSHTAYIFFDNYRHISRYNILNKVNRKTDKKQRMPQGENEDSYWVGLTRGHSWRSLSGGTFLWAVSLKVLNK
jgi:hypothetical protein